MSLMNQNTLLLMMLARREGLEGQDAMRAAVMAGLSGSSGPLGLVAGKQQIEREKELQDLQEPVIIRIPADQPVDVLDKSGAVVRMTHAGGERLNADGRVFIPFGRPQPDAFSAVDVSVNGRSRRIMFRTW